MRIPAFLTLFGFVAASATAGPQSLADLARKEEDRRKVVQGTGKTYTNQDLKAVPAPPPDSSSPGSADATSAVGVTPDATPPDAATTAKPDAKSADDGSAAAGGDKTETKDEAYWRARMEQLKERRDHDELLSQAVQSRINALTADFAGRDDPNQRAQIGIDRQKAITELDRLKKAIVEDNEAIAAFEEEARREGVPAGWLR